MRATAPDPACSSGSRPRGRLRELLTRVEGQPGMALLPIALLMLLAGAVKLWLHPPSFEFNWENRWWQIAVNLARGEGYVACKSIYFPFCGPANQVTAMREPLPVLLFAAIARGTNESLLAASAAGVLLNIGIMLAVFQLTRELATTRAALLAAFLWACYVPPVHIFYGQPSGDLLGAWAVTAGVFHLVRAQRLQQRLDWVAAGLWFGGAILSRSAALVMAVALTAALLLHPRTGPVGARPGPEPRRYAALLFGLAWLLTVSPWLVRNYLAFDRPVIGSTLSGYYLYRQNYMLPSDNYLRFVSGGEFVRVLHEMIARRGDLRGTENEAEMDQVYQEEGLRVIRSEPLRYAALSAYRWLILWFNWGVKDVYHQRNTPGDHLTMLQHALLLLGAAVGLRGRTRRAWPLALSVAVLNLLHMAVMAHMTYVITVVPLLVALSAIACIDLPARLAPSRRSLGLARPFTPLWAGALGLTLTTNEAVAQADSAAGPHQLEEQVVVAHRTPSLLRESVGATTVLDRSTLDRLPIRTVAEALRYVPGLTFIARDGAGELPMAMARGFFGGGETDYVLLTVDGVPTNDLRTGSVEWTQIPLVAIERIEVLRGGASVAYGDAALGAVVNIVTRAALPPARLASELQLGGWGERALRVSLQQPVGPHRLNVDASAGRIEGPRSHADATNAGVSAGFASSPGGHGSEYARLSMHRLRNQEPGPLTQDQLTQDPSQHDPLFGADGRRRDVLALGAGLGRAFGGGHLVADVRGRVADDEQIRTLPLTADAGDTQFQDARSWDVWARLQYGRHLGRTALVAGLEAEQGEFDSRYTDPVDRASLRSRGHGSRTKVGQYVELQPRFGARLRGVAGLRYDLVRFDREAADPVSPSFHQWSPRLGVNFAYTESASQVGHAYVAWTRSFKAPAAYQLYDERLISTGEPDVVINLSNPELRPQHSSGIEVGVYHSQALWGTYAFAELTLAAYRLEVGDEIDFDLSTFRYGNILESRHDGLEGSLIAHLWRWLSLRQALTLTRVTNRVGTYAGNRLRNLPETIITGAAHINFGHGIEGTITHRYLGGMFLDDANREPLAGSHRLDASVSWTLGAIRLQAAAVDLGDSRAPTSGFLVYDPSRDAAVRMLYPDGGRLLRIGLSLAR